MKHVRPCPAQMTLAELKRSLTRAAFPTYATTDADHGRVEMRRAFGANDLVWLHGSKSACTEPVLLPGLACPGMIGSTVTRGGKTTTTLHYYVASRELTPEACLAAARFHWSIENGLNWVLDMTFDEDRPPPKGKRPGKPHHPPKARPQHSQTRQTPNFYPTKKKTLRTVQRIRPINHRLNAIALLSPEEVLAQTGEIGFSWRGFSSPPTGRIKMDHFKLALTPRASAAWKDANPNDTACVVPGRHIPFWSGLRLAQK